MKYEERLKYLKEEYPEMPIEQAESVSVFCDMGWEWEGIGINNSVDIKRAVLNDLVEEAYIREDGSFRYT